MIRHDGELLPLPFRSLSELEARRFIEEILTPPQLETLRREQQVELHVRAARGGTLPRQPFSCRAAAWARRSASSAGACRRWTTWAMPPAVRKLSELTNGLVIVTGPTGAGKSTTLGRDAARDQPETPSGT
jgi:twitching motility protein PilT